MARLEDLTRGASVNGILADRPVTIIDAIWHGDSVLEVVHKDAAGALGTVLLYRDSEPILELITRGQRWRFDADGALLRLVSEARRIQLAHLFDPHLAVHTSNVDPLPHQI